MKINSNIADEIRSITAIKLEGKDLIKKGLFSNAYHC